MTEKNYQMFWNCAHCGTKKLLGISHRHCPNCGAAQDENKRYFPSEGEEVELHNHAYYGVDWDCAYCSTPNSKKSNNCVNCGGSQEGTLDVNLVDQIQKEKQKNTLKPSANQIAQSIEQYHRSNSSGQNISSNNVKENKGFNIIIVLIGFLVAFFIGFMVYGHYKVTDHLITVSEKTWSRSIDIDEYRRVNDTSWCSSMPSDAYSVRSFRDVRSHRQVADGKNCHTERRDKGDGSYSSKRICHTKYRSEPVYDNRCNYTVNRWRFSNSELSSGTDNQEPYFPDVSKYTKNTENVIGNKRAGSRSESYKVRFTYTEDKKVVSAQCAYPQNSWKVFKINAQYNGQVRMIGGLICNDVGRPK